jgi:hypothetical protein
VFDTPNPGIAFTVKYIINPPNTPPNSNLGFILPILINDFISPITIILIKKNTQPTSKLIKVALIADVFLPSSPFIKASNAVDIPANIANIIYCNLVNTIPPYVVILKSYDTSYF